MIPIILIVPIYLYIYIYIYKFFFFFFFWDQRRSSFSKVSHQLGVYFLKFVGLLYGESGVKAYPEIHVCACGIAYFGNSVLEI